VAGDYDAYGPLKVDTAAAVIELIRPIQERYRSLSADPGAVQEVLRKGADKARAVASVTLSRARDNIGLLPPA
jgi:tryptophanyl-tRNA synthetase